MGLAVLPAGPREYADVFERLPPAPHAALVREYVTSASGRGLHPAVLDRLVAPWLNAPAGLPSPCSCVQEDAPAELTAALVASLQQPL